jgi:hypothetical protein
MKRLEQKTENISTEKWAKKIWGSDGSEGPLFDFLLYDTSLAGINPSDNILPPF